MNIDPNRYTALLTDIKQRIQFAQSRAIITVTQELIRLYWEIGALIDHRQQTEGWGRYCHLHLRQGKVVTNFK